MENIGLEPITSGLQDRRSSSDELIPQSVSGESRTPEAQRRDIYSVAGKTNMPRSHLADIQLRSYADTSVCHTRDAIMASLVAGTGARNRT